MIKVNICGSEHEYDSSLTSWIKEQFYNRKRPGARFWFVIKIETSGIKLTLPSEGAPQGPGRPISEFNHREQEMIRLWIDMDIKQVDDVGKLLMFLNRVQKTVN